MQTQNVIAGRTGISRPSQLPLALCPSPTPATETKGWQNEYFNWKDLILYAQQIVEYWSQIKGNAANDDF